METPMKSVSLLAALFLMAGINVAMAGSEKGAPANPYVGADDGYTYVWVNSPSDAGRGAICRKMELGMHGPKGNLRTVFICALPN